MRALAQQEPDAKTDQRPGKYLTFQLGQEEFGIQVVKVREIMGLQDITAVPQTPSYVKGVINLRGKVTTGRWGRWRSRCVRSTPPAIRSARSSR